MNEQTINSMESILNSAKEKKIIFHYDEALTANGKNITISGKKLLNFASCSYLGLEIDQRLKDEAKMAIEKYGIQLSSSRAFVSNTLYTELEQVLEQLFGYPVFLTSTVSLGHHGVMPIAITNKDALILDQQVHASVQDAAKKIQANNVHLTVIRHNDLDALKKK